MAPGPGQAARPVAQSVVADEARPPVGEQVGAERGELSFDLLYHTVSFPTTLKTTILMAASGKTNDVRATAGALSALRLVAILER